MRVAIAGGTGFIGRSLSKALLDRGDEVYIISRSSKSNPHNPLSLQKLNHVTWNELSSNPRLLNGIDAIINLSGETINQRWTQSAKQRIVESRQWAAAQVAKLVTALEHKPSVVVNASAISVYGTSSVQVFDETSRAASTDFLSGVIVKWEEAADAIPVERLIKLRVGVVLDNKDGAFPLMALPYRLFGGGRIGTGKQGLSWIHLEDIVQLILFCLDHDEIEGPVNASAPEPVSNDRFGRSIGRAMGRPHWFPVPAFLMHFLFGEMSTLLLDGQRALPNKALQNGFSFRYPTVDSALNELISRKAHFK